MDNEQRKQYWNKRHDVLGIYDKDAAAKWLAEHDKKAIIKQKKKDKHARRKAYLAEQAINRQIKLTQQRAIMGIK